MAFQPLLALHYTSMLVSAENDVDFYIPSPQGPKSFFKNILQILNHPTYDMANDLPNKEDEAHMLHFLPEMWGRLNSLPLVAGCEGSIRVLGHNWRYSGVHLLLCSESLPTVFRRLSGAGEWAGASPQAKHVLSPLELSLWILTHLILELNIPFTQWKKMEMAALLAGLKNASLPIIFNNHFICLRSSLPFFKPRASKTLWSFSQ